MANAFDLLDRIIHENPGADARTIRRLFIDALMNEPKIRGQIEVMTRTFVTGLADATLALAGKDNEPKEDQ